MVCAPVRSIIPSLKLGDYLSVQAHKPCSISHRENVQEVTRFSNFSLHASLEHINVVLASNLFYLRFLFFFFF